MRQLPLGVQLGVSLRFETYAAGANAEAVEALKRVCAARSNAPVWIYGPRGAGKSHLLQAACAQAGSAGRASAYLPLALVRAEGPAIVEGFERQDLVALDDVDAIAGDDGWEAALFTLYNGIAEHGGRLAMAGSGPPAAIPIRLADLASRLAASEVHRLEPLAESEQPAALRRRAERRGLDLPDETLGFLTRRAPRDFATHARCPRCGIACGAAPPDSALRA